MKEKWKNNYGQKVVITTETCAINFDPNVLKEIVGAEKLSYDDYLEIVTKPKRKVRNAFERCFYSIPLEFKGKIQKKNKEHVCFEKIFISGMYPDGIMFDDKEEHVWMDLDGFEEFQEGDCVTFSAEVYQYLKTSNGKEIDYGLRNPEGIKKVEEYKLPTDNELIAQEMRIIRCEVCYLRDHCDGMNCIKKDK